MHTTSESLSTAALGIDSNISIYKSSSDNIRIVGVQNGTANVQMYNMLGKEVLKTSFEGNGVNDIKLQHSYRRLYSKNCFGERHNKQENNYSITTQLYNNEQSKRNKQRRDF